MAHFGAALRQAARGEPAVLDLVHADRTDPARAAPIRRLLPSDWCGRLRTGDHGLVDRCRGATLDVGCGPGRLTAALSEAGVLALGVDICAEAVRQTHRRGARALRASVFSPLPDEGRWRHILLADGNIGIGGDPHRLLHRCRALLGRGGTVLVELDPPGSHSWRASVAMRHAGRVSAPFPWAAVAADDLAALADRVAFAVLETWTDGSRWFARLGPRDAASPGRPA